MFKITLEFYENYLRIQKDEEIEKNFLQINDLFIKCCKNEITKDYLLDEHTHRNKLIFGWCKIYNF